jgi:hypothetical protein
MTGVCVGACRSLAKLTASQVSLPVACVSSRASILALADRRVLRRQWRLVLWAVWWRSLREPLICQPLAGNPIHETIKPRQGVVLDVAFIQPEGEFVDVAAQDAFGWYGDRHRSSRA